MNNDVVEMTVKINQTAISHDLTEDGWTLGMCSPESELLFEAKLFFEHKPKMM